MRRHARAASLVVAALTCGCAAVPRVNSNAGPAAGESGAALQVAWRRLLTEPKFLEYKPQEFAAAATDGRHVFIGSHGGFFYALRPTDGAVVWKIPMTAGFSGRPLYLADTRTLYVGGDDGILHALDPDTGKERWSYKTKGPIGGTPVYDEGIIYFVNGENRVYAVDAQSGAWRWQYERETPESFTIRGVPAPLVYGGRVYAGFADGYLATLNARTGDVIWARSLAGDAQRFMDVDATPIIVDKVLYVSNYASGVYALDPADGSVKWRYDVEGAGTVRVERGRVFFAAAKNGVYCLDTEGRLVWRQALAAQGEVAAPLLVQGRYLLVSASQGGMYVVDPTEGQLLQFFQPGHGVTAEPMTDGQQIYVLTNNGFFYAFRTPGPPAI